MDSKAKLCQKTGFGCQTICRNFVYMMCIAWQLSCTIIMKKINNTLHLCTIMSDSSVDCRATLFIQVNL